jgi:hypothetical protein
MPRYEAPNEDIVTWTTLSMGDLRSVPWRNAVSLDGRQIAPEVYDLGELLPRQKYAISWGSEEAIGFTTGDVPITSAPAVIAGLDRDPERPAPAAAAAQPPTPLASSRVISAAGTALHPLTFCPAQCGEKSFFPWRSAFARSAAISVVANGNSGASGLIGPSSRIKRLTMPRAGRPVNRLLTAVTRAA